jgi:hypothetical protein
MARLGSQTPTWQHVGDYAESAGEAACAYFAKHGARFYGSQKLEFELMLARDEDGGFAAKSLCITKPRQNGKSYAARWYAIWMAMVCGRKVLYSAHHSRTSRDMFKQIADMLESDEAFSREVDSIYRAGGYEGVYFRKGGCIEFQTRTNSGGRGGTYDIIILDEAQELTPAQQDALLPTVSAAGEIADGASEPQKIYIGTVPGPECQGTVFREMHDRVHAGKSDVWWLEWGAQGDRLEDVDVDNVDLWYACNPAMGRRMRESTVRDEHDTMTRDGFARERLGWWSPTAGLPDFAIPASKWESLALGEAPTEGRAAYGVKFAADGSEVSLAAARLHDGKCYVEQIAREPMAAGTSWLANWIAERKSKGCCCVIDGKAGAQALVDKLGNMPVNYIVTPSAAQVVAACSALVDGVNEGTLEWFRPQADLKDTAVTSTRRRIGSAGGWGFGGENPVPIEAASLALWGVLNSKRNPERKQRIG